MLFTALYMNKTFPTCDAEFDFETIMWNLNFIRIFYTRLYTLYIYSGIYILCLYAEKRNSIRVTYKDYLKIWCINKNRYEYKYHEYYVYIWDNRDTVVYMNEIQIDRQVHFFYIGIVLNIPRTTR